MLNEWVITALLCLFTTSSLTLRGQMCKGLIVRNLAGVRVVRWLLLVVGAVFDGTVDDRGRWSTLGPVAGNGDHQNSY